MHPSEKLNEQQHITLNAIHNLIQGFYEDNDNSYTYPLTGLLSELTKTDYVDKHYVYEKVRMIFGREDE